MFGISAGRLVKQGAGEVSSAMDLLLPSRGSDSVGVVTYHRTAQTCEIDAEDELNVPPETFRAQLAGLQQRGFNFISGDDLLSWHSGNQELPDKPVLVTFDDGYAATALNAEPILTELGIPATMFVNTAFLDNAEPFPFDPNRAHYPESVPAENYRPLDETELKQLIANGVITVGAHSHTHDNFSARPERFTEDVGTNLEILKDRFGLTDVPFAFPYGVVRHGYAGGELSDKLRGMDVSCGFSTEPELIAQETDRYCMGRFTAYPFDSARTLEAKLNGWFSWVATLQTRLSRG